MVVVIPPVKLVAEPYGLPTKRLVQRQDCERFGRSCSERCIERSMCQSAHFLVSKWQSRPEQRLCRGRGVFIVLRRECVITFLLDPAGRVVHSSSARKSVVGGPAGLDDDGRKYATHTRRVLAGREGSARREGGRGRAPSDFGSALLLSPDVARIVDIAGFSSHPKGRVACSRRFWCTCGLFYSLVEVEWL